MDRGVSVIIPVYDRYEELRRAIESVMAQTVQEWEIIVVDDCSPGDIAGVVDSFADERVRLFRNDENRGVSYSRNRGVEEARYPLIALLDSDDEWLPNKLEIQLNLLAGSPSLRVIHTEEIWIRRGKRVNQKRRHKKSGGDIFIPSLELCLISPSSILLKREVFEDRGLFDEELAVCEDYDLWLRITAFEEVGFVEEPQVIKYGGHSDQLSHRYEAMDRFRLQSLLKIAGTIPLKGDKEWALKKMIVRKASILLKGALKRGSSSVSFYEDIITTYNNLDVS